MRNYEKYLALTIKQIRIQQNLKQHVLATALNITQSAYSRIESGTVRLMVGDIKKISLILKISMDDLICIAESVVQKQKLQTDLPLEGIIMQTLAEGNYCYS